MVFRSCKMYFAYVNWNLWIWNDSFTFWLSDALKMEARFSILKRCETFKSAKLRDVSISLMVFPYLMMVIKHRFCNERRLTWISLESRGKLLKSSINRNFILSQSGRRTEPPWYFLLRKNLKPLLSKLYLWSRKFADGDRH